MRVLKVGRPPADHWQLPQDLQLTVLTDVPTPGNWYDVVMIANLTDVELALTALRRAGSPRFDMVHTDYEAAVVMAAVLARALDAEIAVGIDLAVLGRDKYLQKCRAIAAGIPVTDVEMIPQESERRTGFRPSFEYPVILKPTLGSGTVGVARVDNDLALSRVLATIGWCEPYVCERFVYGAEVHIDGIVDRGVLQFLSVGRYACNMIDVHTVKPFGSFILPHDGHERLYADCEALVTQVLDAFSHRQGSLHLEAFVRDDGLVFSECALRYAGARIPDAVYLASGVDLRELSFLASVGCMPDIAVARPVRPAGVLLLTAGPGLLQSIPADADLLAVPGVSTVSLERSRIGELLDRPTTLGSIGYCTFTGDTVESVEQTFERLNELAAEHIRCARP